MLLEAGTTRLGASCCTRCSGCSSCWLAVVCLEGRDGSVTNYLAENYGEQVGMNQNKPSWGLGGEAMDPDNPTMQKPAIVQGAEDLLTFSSGVEVHMIWKNWTKKDNGEIDTDFND